MPELLYVRRDISSVDHHQLRQRMPELNHLLPDYLSVKWRKLGKASITLLNPAEYSYATSRTNSGLRELSISEAKDIITESIKQHPTAYNMADVPTMGTDILGGGDFVHIAYLLDPTSLATERQAITENIDEMNGVNIRWRDFLPHVSIATVGAREVESNSDGEMIVEAFDSIRPRDIGFMGARVHIAK